MRAKLKAILMILRCKEYWVAVVNHDGDIHRLHTSLTIPEALIVSQDILDVISEENDCSNAVNEAARIANGQ